MLSEKIFNFTFVNKFMVLLIFIKIPQFSFNYTELDFEKHRSCCHSHQRKTNFLLDTLTWIFKNTVTVATSTSAANSNGFASKATVPVAQPIQSFIRKTNKTYYLRFLVTLKVDKSKKL